jgi:DnaJ domain
MKKVNGSSSKKKELKSLETSVKKEMKSLQKSLGIKNTETILEDIPSSNKILDLIGKVLGFSKTMSKYFLVCVVLNRVLFSGVPDPNGQYLANLGLLGLNPFITKAQLKKAYYKVRKDYNPDTARNDPKLKKEYSEIVWKANEAYKRLTDPKHPLSENLQITWVLENANTVFNLSEIYKKHENEYYWNTREKPNFKDMNMDFNDLMNFMKSFR